MGDNTKTEEKRGGRREGAGRPKGSVRGISPFCQISLKLPQDIAERAAEQAQKKDITRHKLLVDIITQTLMQS